MARRRQGSSRFLSEFLKQSQRAGKKKGKKAAKEGKKGGKRERKGGKRKRVGASLFISAEKKDPRDKT